MTKAGPLATVWYGLKLIGYLCGVMLLGLVPVIVGLRPLVMAAIQQGPFAAVNGVTPVNVVLVVVGLAIMIGGQFGLLFKVVTDAVDRGNRGHERELLAEVDVETQEHTEADVTTEAKD